MSKGPSKQESVRQDPHGKADWDWYGSVRAYAHSGISPDEPETPERAQPYLGFTCASVYRGGEPQLCLRQLYHGFCGLSGSSNRYSLLVLL